MRMELANTLVAARMNFLELTARRMSTNAAPTHVSMVDTAKMGLENLPVDVCMASQE